MPRKYLVTGGAGFIGSNFVRYVLEKEPDASVTNVDLLTYAGVKATVDELDRFPGHSFVLGDIREPDLVDRLMEDVDVVVHFAAESHVDRSITGPSVFLETNVVGTGVLLDAAARQSGKRVYYPTVERSGDRELTALAELQSASELVTRGRRFAEPPEGAPLAARGDVGLVVVPALAVAASGHRLGYGGGFYDAMLPDFRPPAVAVVVAFDFQLIAELPVEAHDVACDVVVTDARVLGVARK